jgi:hypothetical protein
MAIVSHLHHLFNVETCQASIHTLRWKERPLQCPRCQSRNVGPWDFLPFVNPHWSIFYLICTTASRRIRLTS